MAPHSSTLAWKIPWMEAPGRLQSMGSLRVGHDWATSLSLFTFMHWRRYSVFLPGESQARFMHWRRYSSVLAWRIPGTAEPGGLPSIGSHRVGHDWSDLAAAVREREKASQNSICLMVSYVKAKTTTVENTQKRPKWKSIKWGGMWGVKEGSTF